MVIVTRFRDNDLYTDDIGLSLSRGVSSPGGVEGTSSGIGIMTAKLSVIDQSVASGAQFQEEIRHKCTRGDIY